MLFENTSGRDLMIPVRDPKYSHLPPTYLTVKAWTQADLPEEIGKAYKLKPIGEVTQPSADLPYARDENSVTLEPRAKGRKGK